MQAAGEKREMQGSCFRDRKVIRNTASQVRGTRSEDSMGGMLGVIHSPNFGTWNTESLNFGTKSENDMNRIVGDPESPKFGTEHKDSLNCGKCPASQASGDAQRLNCSSASLRGLLL